MKKVMLILGLFEFLAAPALLAQQWDTLAPIPESFTFAVVAVADGKIHIMGGGGASGATDHHFAYDPATDTWDSKAPVPYKAQQPAGATANGKIHFFGGGFPNSGTPLKDHYIYDPATDSWAQAADLTAARAIHYAVALDDVLYSLAGQGVANLCQTYDPGSDSWVTKNNLPDNQFWYGAHVATEGHIYRFGGGGYTAPKNFAHVYNPDVDSWSPLPLLPNATHGLKGAAIGSKIYLSGGYYDFEDHAETWIFDTQTLEYTLGTPLPIGRSYHNMVSLDSCIYSLGGNHAIDETVKFQLLRLCPYASVSNTESAVAALPLEAMCLSGKLYLRWPEDIKGSATISMFDMSGRQVLAEKAASASGELYETWVGNLPTSIYFVRLQADNAVYTCKVFAN